MAYGLVTKCMFVCACVNVLVIVAIHWSTHEHWAINCDNALAAPNISFPPWFAGVVQELLLWLSEAFPITTENSIFQALEEIFFFQ